MMTPEQKHKTFPPDAPHLTDSLESQDKERHDEGDRHHPMDHPLPHAPHHPQGKTVLPPRHDAHSHLHGDDLPEHTNPPSPIKPSKKMTKKGTE
ncbi:hypothetical protein [uncultured Methanospirillum sp.]|uniref:hypothetical protein n=1 Tax=uncultured Methanospirillum sp. TaxID=262503 RepID=UPI0029C85FAC|nr:hypothetical protein [uncultured Methanospirillum sp.]